MLGRCIQERLLTREEMRLRGRIVTIYSRFEHIGMKRGRMKDDVGVVMVFYLGILLWSLIVISKGKGCAKGISAFV